MCAAALISFTCIIHVYTHAHSLHCLPTNLQTSYARPGCNHDTHSPTGVELLSCLPSPLPDLSLPSLSSGQVSLGVPSTWHNLPQPAALVWEQNARGESSQDSHQTRLAWGESVLVAGVCVSLFACWEDKR